MRVDIVVDERGRSALLHLDRDTISEDNKGSPVGVLLEPDSRATVRNEAQGCYQIIANLLDLRVIRALLIYNSDLRCRNLDDVFIRAGSNGCIPRRPSSGREWEISESLDITRFTAINLGVRGGRLTKTSERIALHVNGYNISTVSTQNIVVIYNETTYG
jgi:hypothetical protein